MLAGLGAGLTEAIVITPFERVKVHLQAQRNKLSEVHIHGVCVCAHTFASLCVCKRESCKGKAVINYQITCVRKTEIHL